MDIAIKAMLAGFIFGFLACALVLWLQYKRNLREARKLLDEARKLRDEARKLRDEVRNTMRNTIYPSSAGWWELHQKLEAVGAKTAKARIVQRDDV